MKLRFVLLGLWIAFWVVATPSGAQPLLPAPPNLEALLKKANVNGKYAMLLLQVEAPEDEATWGEFNDRGFHPEGAVGKDVNVPAGYRVYAKPYWFIWRDKRMEKRPWGPEQLIGEPDTKEAGDYQTAWASKSQDDQDEWLLLEYDAPLVASTVSIYETHNPGAVTKISAFGLDGHEEEIWTGRDNPAQGTVFINQKNFPRPFKTNRLKIYLDSKSIAGWNEIDAVGLSDRAGKIHWATNAEASSTYASKSSNLQTGFVPATPEGDLLKLYQKFQQMQNDINELRQKAGLPPRGITPLPQLEPQLDLFLGGKIEREALKLDANPRAEFGTRFQTPPPQ